MNIQKTSGMASSAHNASSPKPPPAQTAKPLPASLPSSLSRSAAALVTAAGLPSDTLSASIVSSARFFSLPLKPELMAAIRRQTLSPAAATPSDSGTSGTLVKNRETLSLAAAAAESKGVELRPRGLELFAEAIDPDWQRRQSTEEHREQEQRHKNHHEQEKGNAQDDEAPPKTSPPSAADLRKMALESMEKDTLLAILNKLPGKNGQRWMVFPFQFSEHGRTFSVSLRILLDTHNTRMIVDITESAETKRQWLFVLESANGAAAQLTVYLQPPFSPQAITAFTRELSQFTAIPLERISVKTRTAYFPGELSDALSPPINEAV